MAEDYKKAVLDRLEDAVALYEKERYVASLYMSGYVIEIGIKVEFKRLSNIPFSQFEGNLKKIIKSLSGKEPTNLNTLQEFMEYAKEIAGSFYGNKKLENRNDYRVIKIQKYDTESTDEDKKLHDINGFLKKLKEWKEYTNESSFIVEDYDIVGKYKWKTDLRYGASSYSDEDEERDRRNAKGALEMAIKFLENVVCLNEEDRIKVSIYKNKFLQVDNVTLPDSSSVY